MDFIYYANCFDKISEHTYAIILCKCLFETWKGTVNWLFRRAKSTYMSIYQSKLIHVDISIIFIYIGVFDPLNSIWWDEIDELDKILC